MPEERHRMVQPLLVLRKTVSIPFPNLARKTPEGSPWVPRREELRLQNSSERYGSPPGLACERAEKEKENGYVLDISSTATASGHDGGI